MKTTYIFLAVLALGLTSCTTRTASTVTADPAAALISRLGKLQAQGCIAIGHHDDTAYGHAWKYEPGRSDVKEVTGDYPAILSWDLGLIETGSDHNLDGVPFDFIRQQAISHDANGGLSTFSWHLRNPLTKGDAWDTSDSSAVRHAITPGDSVNLVMADWIGKVADFFLSIKEVPVIFRPWHEHTGNWFWWGIDQCDKEDYIALWKMTRRIFDQKGVNNVVWAYSPDKSNCNDVADYLDRYPGDEYVDIMGVDVYHINAPDGVEQFSEWMSHALGAATEASRAHNKVVALTETGSESVPMNGWYTQVLMPLIENYPIAYLCLWRNAHDQEQHFFAPYPGHEAEADFVQFHHLPQTAFLKEISLLK